MPAREFDGPEQRTRCILAGQARQRSSLRRRLPWLAVLVVLAGGGYFGWRHLHSGQQAAAPKQPRPAAVPVTFASAQKGDLPVYLNGLGTVQPYDTVTVRSRVDGQITKIAFKQGQMVKEGDLLVQIDPRPVPSGPRPGESKKTQDEANLKNAQLNLQRYSSLAKEDFASKQQLENQQATVAQLTAQISGDQAAIDNAQTQVSYTTIRAPLSGKTGFRLVDPGNIVHASDQTGIVTIVKLQPISVVFTAPEEEVDDINKALAAGEVPVTALSSDGLTHLSEGHLALVNNEVDQASGTIRMKATFENKDNILWPGLSVSTRLLVTTLKGVIIVPQDGGRSTDRTACMPLRDRRRQQGGAAEYERRQQGDGKIEITKGLNRTAKMWWSPANIGFQPGHARPAPRATRAPGQSRPTTCRPRRPDREGRSELRAARQKRNGRHLRALHPLPDRDILADDRHPVRRHRRYPLLPVAPFRRSTSRRSRSRRSFRRRPLDHGVGGRATAGNAVRPDPGVPKMTSTSTLGSTAITLQFDLNRDIDARVERRAGRDQRGRRPVAQEPSHPPTFRKVNPADSPILFLAATSDSLP